MDSVRADPKVEPPFDVSSPDDAGRKQIWSITQFYSVGFLLSIMLCVRRNFFSTYTCPGTSIPSTAQITVTLFLISFGNTI